MPAYFAFDIAHGHTEAESYEVLKSFFASKVLWLCHCSVRQELAQIGKQHITCHMLFTHVDHNQPVSKSQLEHT